MDSANNILIAGTDPAGSAPGQHSIPQTILHHLLPGALITIAFILIGPW